MSRAEMPMCILNEVQEFDQQIAGARAVPQKPANLCQGCIIVLTPLRIVTAFATAATSTPNTFAGLFRVQCHCDSPKKFFLMGNIYSLWSNSFLKKQGDFLGFSAFNTKIRASGFGCAACVSDR
jgi:hypothetical protein